MEREILFRGKRTDNGDWVEGDLIHLPLGIAILANGYAYIDSDTVGQYTGLKDKNGKRIFENDIIRSTETGEIGIVQWFVEHSAFMVWLPSPNQVGFLYECTKSIIEVVGYIHDNPEMMKGE